MWISLHVEHTLNFSTLTAWLGFSIGRRVYPRRQQTAGDFSIRARLVAFAADVVIRIMAAMMFRFESEQLS
jgi:hypothetical protein